MALRIRLTGSTTLENQGNVVSESRLGGRQVRLVLALLVLERHRAVARGELADILWPDELPNTWEPALRGVLSRVRAALTLAGLPGNAVLTSAFGCYQLTLPPNAVVDVEMAVSAEEAAHRALADDDPEHACEYGAAAREVLLRPFLAGDDTQWAEEVRSDLRARLFRTLLTLSQAHILCGEIDAAVTAAEDAVALEALRESGYRCLMAAHAAAGNRGDALRAYERCRHVLAEELGVEPSGETETLYLKLLGEEPNRTLVPPRPLQPTPFPAALRAPAPFFGRSDEISNVLCAWDKTMAGQRQLVLIEGEAGIGKTALAAHVASRAADQDQATVLYGRCERHSLLPFQPFAEAVAGYAEAAPLDHLRQELEKLPELMLLAPQLADRIDGLDTSHNRRRDNERQRLLAAAAAFFTDLANVAPVMLVIDDVHWAGAGVLLLLRYLVRSLASTPVLFILTYRGEDIRDNVLAAETLADLRRDLTALVFALQGLDPEAVGALVADRAHGLTDRELRELQSVLPDETAGNPFYILELLRHVEESRGLAFVPNRRPLPREEPPRDGSGTVGELVADLAELPVSTPSLAGQVGVRELLTTGVPETIAYLTDRRLARLNDQAQQVVMVASVAGREFDLDVVQRVTRLDDDEFLDAVDEAVAARFVQELHGFSGRYHFPQGTVRDAVYNHLGGARRASLHRRVGEALESLHAEEVDQRLVELSHHFWAAGHSGNREKGIDYLLRAGNQAMDQLAYERAAVHFGRALEFCPTPVADVQRCQILMALATADRKAGRVADARNAYLEAAALARRLGNPHALASCALGLAAGGEKVSAWIADEVRLSLLEEALEVLGDNEDELRVKVLADLAKALYFSEQHQRRDALAHQAVEIARRIGDPSALASALSASRVVLSGPAHTDLRLAYSQEMLSFAKQLGDVELCIRGYLGRVPDLIECGDRQATDRALEFALGLLPSLNQPYYRWRVITWDALRAMIDGRLDNAERQLKDALLVWRDEPLSDALWCSQVQVAAIQLLRGASDEAIENILNLADAVPVIPAFRCIYASFLAAGGHLTEAAGEFERFAADGFVRPPFDANWLVGMAALAQTCAYLHDTQRAEVLHNLLVPFADRLVVLEAFGGGGMFLGSVQQHLGVLAAMMGDQRQADARLRAAVDAHRRFGARVWEAASQAALDQSTRGRMEASGIAATNSPLL